MIKLHKSYMPLISLMLIVTLVYSIGLTGFVGISSVNADNDDPNANNLELSNIKIVSSGPYNPGTLVDLSCDIYMKNGNLGQTHFFLGQGDKHNYVEKVDLGSTSSLVAKETKSFTGKLQIPLDINFNGLDTATLNLQLFAYGLNDRDCQQVAASSDPIDFSLTITKPFVAAPALTLSKVAKNAAGDVITSSVVGQEITYEYTITNTGNVDITGITVTDDKKTGAIEVGSLAKSASPVTVTWKTTPTETGPITNNATAQGFYGDQSVPATAYYTVNIVSEAKPGLTLTKTAQPNNEKRNWAVPGETIYYSYEINNTGNVDITGITVTDDKKTDGPVWTGTVAASKTEVATWSYLVKPTDAGHKITNLATLTCNELKPGITDTCTVYVVCVPCASITVEKLSAAPYLVVPGNITYTYKVTNTGDLPLTITSLTDNKIPDAATQTGAVGTLLAAKGGSATFTVTSPSISQTYADDWTVAQEITNTVEVVASWTCEIVSDLAELVGGNRNLSFTVSGKDNETVQLYRPAISVTKTTTDADTQYKAGETINYKYVIKNEGNITLTNILLTDDKFADPIATGFVLVPGSEAVTYTAAYPVTSTTALGPLTNTATVKGYYMIGETTTYPEGQTPPYVTDQDSKTVTIYNDSTPVTYSPSINIKKTADLSVAYPGDTITYTYKVTNSGTTALTNITVTDDKLGNIVTSEEGKSLAVGDSFTVTKTFNVTSDTDRGTLKNVATVNAEYNKEPITPATASASVEISRRHSHDSSVTTSTSQPIVVPAEPMVVAPIEPVLEPTPEPALEPVVVPEEPKADLPYTGGDTLAYVLVGAFLCALGLFAIRRLES